MADIGEILVANGIAVLMMLFLLICRHRNREAVHADGRLYDAMAVVNLLGAVFETVSFLVDGRDFPGGRIINIASTSLCFAGTVSIGFLWCLYVELRIYRNLRRTLRNAKYVMIPWVAETVAIICNLFVPGSMFTVSETNVYERCAGSLIGYLTLFLYFGYSVFLVYSTKRQGVNLNFFPVLFFVGPCLAGVLLQLFFYGITTSWVSVAVALTFVQLQQQSENLYTDELSGLYNRRYLNCVLGRGAPSDGKSMYGIMMDMDDFKSINDTFGHNAGDRAICAVGDIMVRTLPENGIPVRCAGDEFAVLLTGAEEETVQAAVRELEEGIERYNQTSGEPFTLAASIGYARYEQGDSIARFMGRMDESMYRVKHEHYRRAGRPYTPAAGRKEDE